MNESDNESIAGQSASEFGYDDNEDIDLDPVGSSHDEGYQDDDEMVIEPPEVRRAPYTIMNRQELGERQMRCLKDAMELLDVTLEESFMLLRENGWDLGKLQEAWFECEDKVRRACGVAQGSSSSSSCPPPGANTNGQSTCPVCMTVFDQLFMIECGHGLCQDCWTGYLTSKVDDGKSVIQTGCPMPKCGRAVPPDLFARFCDEDRQKKYREWYVRSYVDDNPIVKWCPNPGGCELACEYQGVDAYEIRCGCSFLSCWACGEEAHSPASCKTVHQWNIKNSAESENISWIRANTKKCPKCHKPIEKNQGCNHMVCSKAGGCGHEFCWLCLGEWHLHNTATGGYYQCNIYDKQTKEGTHAEDEKVRIKAKHSLDKYMFFFERFMNHDKAMKLTVKQEVEIERNVQTLHDRHGFEIIELQFLYEALHQVRQNRRVLKWSYVYGYYIEENGAEKNLFEFLQKNLEEMTDALHEKLEKDLENQILNDDSVPPQSPELHKKFMDFRSKVSNYTLVSNNHLNQVITDIGAQGGLTMGNAQAPAASSAKTQNAPAPAAAKSAAPPWHRSVANRKG